MKTINNQRGITLIALVITIIVLLILASVTLGSITGMKGNIAETNDTMLKTELTKIQQAILENYLKYKQTGNERVIKGIKVSYSEANTELKKIDSSLELRASESLNPEESYYKIQNMHLNELGLMNVNNNDEFIVNYSTGEVFNITKRKTENGNNLYVYAK